MATQDVDGAEWYLQQDGAPAGPYSISDLQAAVAQRNLTPDDLVWRSGWDDWRPAATVTGLFVPPPLGTQAKSALKPEAADAPPVARDAPGASARTPWGARGDMPLQVSRNDALAAAPELRTGADFTLPGLPETRSRRNYLTRHWRGELSLPVAFWVNGFACNFVLSVAAAFFTIYIETAGLSAALAASVVVFTVAQVAVWVWQIVGMWRSAARHRERGGRAFWAGLAQVVVVLGVLRSVAYFGQSLLPMTLEYARIALGDNELGETRFHLSPSGAELEISGALKLGTAEKFAQILDAAEQVKAVHLTSQGGRVGEADRIAELVRERKLITYVSDYCESACTHVFLAGRERWMADGAKLGFHQPDFPGMGPLERTAVIGAERAALISAGLPERFADRAVATPPDQMWYPSQQELLAARVISIILDRSPSDAADDASSPAAAEGVNLRPYEVVLVGVQRTDPAMYKEIMGKLSDGIKAGWTEEELSETAQHIFGKVFWTYMPHAPADALLEMHKLVLSYLLALNTSDPESCVALLTPDRGAQFKADLSLQFPDIWTREVALRLKVLQAGRPEAVPIPSHDDVEPIIDSVFAEMKKDRSLHLDLLDLTKLRPDQYKPYCELQIAYYRAIARLPLAQAVPLLRHHYSSIHQAQ
ncbi:MAG TPA: GYF domain-containing protein [Xanthobacteraceae bacterium]|nr:GYF domain-containing protein [Xanthobacteraceae bacterium]